MAHVADRWHVVKAGTKTRTDRYGCGSRWQAVWLNPATNRELTKAFANKVDAALARRGQRLGRHRHVRRPEGRERVAAYGEQWRAVQVHRPSTAELYEIVLRRHIYPRLGDRPLASVLPSDVKALVKTWAATAAQATVETRYRVLTAVFGSAVADRRIVATPCVGVSLPKKHKPKVIPIQTEVVRALEAALPARARAMVTLAAGCGMRQGKVLGLTVDRVDFLRRTVTLDRQLVTVRGQAPTFGPPKTEASVRTIPLPTVVAESLAEHLQRFPVGPDGLVFTNVDGDPIRRNGFGMMWAKAAKAADTSATFHAWRHYYASLLIRHGESVKTVQARLGHKTAAETLDTYAPLWPDSDDRSRDAVDAVLGSSHGPAPDQSTESALSGA